MKNDFVFLDLTTIRNIGPKRIEFKIYQNKTSFGRIFMVYLTISFYDKVRLCEIIENYTCFDFQILLEKKVLFRIFELFPENNLFIDKKMALFIIRH